MKKADIEQYWENGRWHPSVNVKVYKTAESVKLPMALMRVKGPNDKNFRTTYTHPDFTHDWIEENLADDDNVGIFELIIDDGREWIREAAKEIFGPYVKTWFVGRSGGHCIVEGLDPIESWDAIAVTKWARFVRICKSTAEDVPRSIITHIYFNIFEPDHNVTVES